MCDECACCEHSYCGYEAIDNDNLESIDNNQDEELEPIDDASDELEAIDSNNELEAIE